MKTERLLTNIYSSDLPASRDFYVQRFGFEVAYDSDWFVNLLSPDKKFEIGIIDKDSEVIPEGHRGQQPQGVYLTFVVPDVARWLEEAKAAGVEIVASLKDTEYGQRRCLVKDPNGLLLDVSTPVSRLEKK